MVMINKKQQRLQYWQNVLEQQKASGLAKKKFCEINNLKLHQFKYYYCRSRQPLRQATLKETAVSTSFAPVKIATPARESADYFSLLLPGNIHCCVPFNFDPSGLKMLLKVLQS